MPLLAETFFQRYDHILTAALSLVIAGALILAVDRTVKRRGRDMRTRLALELDPVTDTRLRFVRRLIEAGIAIIGIGVGREPERDLGHDAR